MMTVVVAARQLAADVDGAPRSARLVVLPKLALAGSCFLDHDLARSRAETLDGPTVALLRELSADAGITVVAGFPLAAWESTYNAAVVVDSGAVLGVYRKVHPWGAEPDGFETGREPPLVVDTTVGRLGVTICYDLEFPEWVRLAAEAGAEIIAVPANWPRHDRPPGVHAIEVAKAQAAAAYYGVHVVVADRCGVERGLDWVGGSLICDRTGYLLAGPATGPFEQARPTVLTASIEPAAARDKRIGARNDAFKDRQPDLYGQDRAGPYAAN
jgi:predicted amidohydrolase